jgi:hypothetical protein
LHVGVFFPERGFVWIIFFFLFEKNNAGDGALIEVEGKKGWEVPFVCEVRILGEFVACVFPVRDCFCEGLVIRHVCFAVAIDCGSGVFVLGDILFVMGGCVRLFGEFIQVWGEDDILFEFVDVDGTRRILDVIVSWRGSIGGISWVTP